MLFKKTELGLSALQNRSIALTPRQRSAFILFDGKRDSEEVLASTSGLGVTVQDVDHMLALGLLTRLAGAPAEALRVPEAGRATPQLTAGIPADAVVMRELSAQQRYSNAYPIAARLTAGLGLRGFRLNLAVEGAGDLEKLRELSPRIKSAVGPEKFAELEHALFN